MYPNGFYNMPFVNPYNAVGAASALPRTGGLLSKLGLRNINFGNILTNNGAKITDQKDMGNRELAYEIKKCKGHCIVGFWKS